MNVMLRTDAGSRVVVVLAAFLTSLSAGAASFGTGVTGAEATAGADPVTLNFLVTRGGTAESDLWVRYHTQDGSAVADVDYVPASGTLKIPTGASEAIVPVTVLARTTAGADKTLELVLDGATRTGPAPSLGTPQSITLPNGAFDSLAADLNADGRPDAIGVSQGAQQAMIRLNTTVPGSATTTFAAGQSFALPETVWQTIAADLNGDGTLDLISAGSAEIFVLANTTPAGAATLSFSTSVIPFGSQPTRLVAADINLDGKQDLVLFHYNGPSSNNENVLVLLNTTAPGAASLSFSQHLFEVGFSVGGQIADFNADGKPDFFTVYPGGSGSDAILTVVLNSTAPGASVPSLGTNQNFGGGAALCNECTAAADLNLDGLPDLMVGDWDEDQTVKVLLNTTTPSSTVVTFSQMQIFPLEAPTFIRTSDLNGDGKRDLLVALNGGGIQILTNTTAPGAPSASFDQSFLDTARSFSLSAGIDFNGDGRPDLLSSDMNGVVQLHLNTTPAGPAASFRPAQNVPTSPGPNSVAALDFGLTPGTLDLLTTNGGNDKITAVVNHTPAGSADTVWSFGGEISTTNEPFSMVVGEINHDGLADLAWVTSDNNSVVVAASQTPNATFVTGTQPRAVAIAEINGDGRGDLVTANEGGNSFSVLLNTTPPGATTTTYAAHKAFTTGTSPWAVTTADLNRDGKADVVTANLGSNNISVRLNKTAGGAAIAAMSANQAFAMGTNPTAVVAADLNNDGVADVATANGAGNVAVRLNTTAQGAASAAFASPKTFFVESIPRGIQATDVDADGRLDLVVANGGSDTVSFLRNTTVPGATDVTFAAAQSLGTGDEPVAIIAADLNNDGKPDLATANQSAATVSVLLNNQYLASIDTSSALGTIHFVGPPAAATNLTATAGDSRITLNWTAAANATSYQVFQGTSSNGQSGTPVMTVSSPTAVVTGLVNGVPYYFKVVALNGAGASGPSGEASATPVGKPIAPKSLAGVPGNGKVTLSWTGSPGATSYRVFQGTSAGGESTTPVQTGIAGTTTTVTGLANGTQYFFKVKAANSHGVSPYSNEAKATPQALPSVPAGLRATAGNAQVTLTWNAAAGAASYNVYQGTTAGGQGATPVRTGVTGTSVSIAPLTNETTYYFTVASVNGDGESARSNEASAKPTAKPATPTNLAAAAGNAQVTLTWTASAGATSYRVFQGTTANGEATTAVKTGITGTATTISGLTNGVTYYFKVKAANAAGLSAYSNEASATPVGQPSAPTNLTAVPGNQKVTLSWTASPGAASYNVYRGTTAGGESSTPVLTGVTGTTVTVSGLQNGTTYYFKLKAVNAHGNSGYSNEASAKPSLL